MLANRIENIDNLINAIPLHQYWSDFQVIPYAFFDEKDVYLFNHPHYPPNNNQKYSKFERTAQFNACTTILFENYPTAIIDVSYYKSDEQLYAILIHELFHGHQHLKDETRFPNELLGTEYPIEAENFEYRNLERVALYEAITAKNGEQKYEHMQRFVSLRTARNKKYKEFVEYENLLETIEGPAYYLEFLAFLKAAKGNRDEVLKEYIALLIDLEKSSLNIRQSCYASGLGICLLLELYLPNWKGTFFNSNQTLFAFIEKFTETKEIHEIAISEQSIQMALRIMEMKKREIEDFISKNGMDLYIEGDIKVLFFDPINVVSFENQLLYKTFIQIQIKQKEYAITQPCLVSFENETKKIKRIHLKSQEKPMENEHSIVIEHIGEIEGTLYKNSPQVMNIKV